MCGNELLGKRVDSDAAICLVRQQGGGDALYLASWFLALEQLVNCHSGTTMGSGTARENIGVSVS
jgi:hypothetical protein